MRSVRPQAVFVGYLDPAEGRLETAWQDESSFAKGLAVVGEVAYFGCSEPSTRTQRWTLPCEIVTVDLPTGEELGRVQVPREGLVNATAQVGQLDAARGE